MMCLVMFRVIKVQTLSLLMFCLFDDCFGFEQKCHVKKKDIRKFLDGIYVSEKGKIAVEE